MDRSTRTNVIIRIRASALVILFALFSVNASGQSETSDFARIGHAAFLSTTLPSHFWRGACLLIVTRSAEVDSLT